MKWYKDGKEITLGDRMFFTYDGDRVRGFRARFWCVIEYLASVMSFYV